MLTNHVDKHLEAYLDQQLSPEKKAQVEQHLNHCPTCTRALADARRVRRELGSVLQTVWGKPSPPPRLRHQVRQAIEAHSRTGWFNWTAPLKFLNAVGSVAMIALLAGGLYVVIQGQIPVSTTVFQSETAASPARPVVSGGSETQPTATVVAEIAVAAGPTPQRMAKSDTLPATAKAQPEPETVNPPAAPAGPVPKHNMQPLVRNAEAAPAPYYDQPAKLPGGTIAYALFEEGMYQIHLIAPDGTRRQQFPMPGVSEPALHPGRNDFALAFRSWNDPSGPRTLVSSDLAAEQPEPVTHFWEDAQPDWSPTENRIIFASQRESDRRWRLYSVWGDGSLETNLRREGRSPTFAPDGLRFAFEGCDETGSRCGLWLSDLNNSEFKANLFLADPLAKSPDWSPAGEKIAYMANPDDNWDLYIVNSDGSNRQRLTTDPASDGLPVWSPDGEWLAFVSNREDKWGIWILHVDSGAVHQTVTFDEDATLGAPDRSPYRQQEERYWWDEQLSWGQ